jgi:hypothetical protein
MVLADASQIYRSMAEDAERPQFFGLASTLTSAKTALSPSPKYIDNGIEKDAELLEKLENTAYL